MTARTKHLGAVALFALALAILPASSQVFTPGVSGGGGGGGGSGAAITWTQTTTTLSAATSTTLLAANANRKALRWMVSGANPVTIAPGAVTVVAGTGMNYNGAAGVGQQGGSDTFGSNEISTGAYSAISTLGTTVIVWEGQ